MFIYINNICIYIFMYIYKEIPQASLEDPWASQGSRAFPGVLVDPWRIPRLPWMGPRDPQ